MINNNILTLIVFLCFYSFLFTSFHVLNFVSGVCFDSFCKKVRLLYKRFIIKKRYVQFLVKHSSLKDLLLEILCYPFDFLFWFFKRQVVGRFINLLSFFYFNLVPTAERGETWVDHFIPKELELDEYEDAFLLDKLNKGTLTVVYLDSLDFSDYSKEFREKWEGAGFTARHLPSYEVYLPSYSFLMPFFIFFAHFNHKYYAEVEHLDEYLEYWIKCWGFYEPVMQAYLIVRYYEPDNDNQIDWFVLTEYETIGFLVVLLHVGFGCIWLSLPSVRSAFYNSRYFSDGCGGTYAIILLTVFHCVLFSELMHAYGYDCKLLEIHIFAPFINSIGYLFGYEEAVWVVKRWDQIPIDMDLVMYIPYDPIPRTIYPDYGPDYGSALAPGYSGFSANDMPTYTDFNGVMPLNWIKEYFAIWGTFPETRTHFYSFLGTDLSYHCDQMNAAYGNNKSIYSFYGFTSEYTVLTKEFWEFEYAYTKDWEFHWRKSWRFMPWEDPVW